MNKSKKLFNSEDFDKKKPLFESEDFDKPVVEDKKDGQRPFSASESVSSPHSAEKPNKAKIIGALVVVAVIIAGGIFFANNGKDIGSNKPTTETTAQEGESHATGNNTFTTKPKNNVEVALSDVAEEKTATNEVNSESSVTDESHVTTSTEKTPTAPSEKSGNSVDGDVEVNARRVIRGDFGNGQERKDKLGASYPEIQGKVNEMYRQGLVH